MFNWLSLMASTICCHQCQRGRLLEMFNRLSLMASIAMKNVIDGTRSILGRSCRATSIRSKEIVQRMFGMFYRQRKIVIDGKYNSTMMA
jgi:hypothetical protein